MRIDAHQHFWKVSGNRYGWLSEDDELLYRDFGPQELKPLLDEAGIDKTVLVQSGDYDWDTVYMLEQADAADWIAGIVGWVPLDQPDEAGKRLEAYKKNPLFKGVRHLIHNEKDPDWVIRDRVIEGLKVLSSFDLTFDVVAVFPNHLKHVPVLAEKVPDLRIAIDHLAKPPILSGIMEPWASQLRHAAQYPQVYAKISGLNTACDWVNWSYADIRPYVDAAVASFGPDRLMFGSDWPIANLAGDYKKVWEETLQALKQYSKAEQDAILGGTAARFYRI